MPSPNSGSATRSRIRGTIREAHSCAASSRSQPGTGSSSSSRLTFTRSRLSASSARHIAVSSGFISGAVPQSSGTAGGGPGTRGSVTVTGPEPRPGQSASVSRYWLRTSCTCRSSSPAVQPRVGTGGSTATCTLPARIVDAPRHISSPELRMTMGTIGTPACIATWNAPFLNGPSAGVAERVPSGAMTSEIPSRSFRTAGSSALRACAVLPRSMNVTSASRNISPSPGAPASSFLATPVNPPRSSLARMSTSSWLWWLNRKTAGRVARYCAPWTSSRTPASTLPSSPASVMPRLTASRREPVGAPSATPAAKPPAIPARPAAVRAISAAPARPRDRNLVIGQP